VLGRSGQNFIMEHAARISAERQANHKADHQDNRQDPHPQAAE
jgi:hypothetical protein